jgi:Na+/pantothenate symporter
VGLYAHAILGGGVAESDLVVPQLLGDARILPALPSAFIVVAMLAAAMSSIDSVLLVMASTWERDLVSLVRDVEETKAVRETRRYVALFALITALLAANPPGSIVTLTAFSGSLYAACFFPAVVLGLFWRRGDGRAVIASLLAGVLVLVAWDLLPFADVVHEVFPAMALATLSYVAFASASPPVSAAARLDAALPEA